MNRNRLVFLCGFLGLGVTAGCTKSEPFEIVDVTGTVTVDDRPATNALIYFSPRRMGDGEVITGPQSIGIVDQEGKYRLYLTVGALREGAVTGSHTVYIYGAESKDQFLSRYGDEPPPEKLASVRIPEPYCTEGAHCFVYSDDSGFIADFSLTSEAK